VTGAASNFGEVEISQIKILSISGLRIFKPPQLCDRWRTNLPPSPTEDGATGEHLGAQRVAGSQ
jgi:hypothetical protein